MDGVAYLINKTYRQNEIGEYVESVEYAQVYVEEKSVTRAEWRDAGQFGLHPSIVLVTPAVNYAGQEEIKYNDVVYSVYRTYSTCENVELYLQKKVGV